MPSAAERGSTEPAFQGFSGRQTSPAQEMLILGRLSPLRPTLAMSPHSSVPGCGVVTSAVPLALPVRWDEAGENVSHAGPCLPWLSGGNRKLRRDGSLSLPCATTTPSFCQGPRSSQERLG